MRKSTKMLLMAGEANRGRQEGGRRGNQGGGQRGGQRGESNPRQEYGPTGNYPEWMPWYEAPYQGGEERQPRQGERERWRMEERSERRYEPRQDYMGFGEREEPESRRGRTRTGRYKRANMGKEEYEDDDRDEEEDEPRKGHSKVMSLPHKLDEETAREWMESLQNEDGSKGPHWTMEQTKQVAKQKGIQHDDLTWYVVMNVMYSDYYAVAKKFNVNNMDFYIGLAQAFLEDKDAVENKLYSYYKHIVK